MNLKSNEIVSIIVVASGKNEYLKPCLDSIQKQTYPKLEIIVIDNSLNRNFSQSIIERYPEIKLYSQKQNISYCEALNLGIKQSTGDFILCLNDVFIEQYLVLSQVFNRIAGRKKQQ